MMQQFAIVAIGAVTGLFCVGIVHAVDMWLYFKGEEKDYNDDV